MISKIYGELRQDIQQVEQEISAAINTEHPILNDASHHLLHAGGKRLRPIFVLLAGKFGEYSVDRLKYVAAPLELIHMASLVHDDVIDDAEMRRGKLTVKSKWDNRIAMYTGDYIFARSLKLISRLPNPAIHQVLSDAVVEMSEGEIEQIRDFFNWRQNVRNYLRRIKRKTALLISVSCKLGAMVSMAKPAYVRALSAYGYNVGMAFQITDDILDFTATSEQLGKPAGSDLKQGNVTLPVIYALSKDNYETRTMLQSYLQSEGKSAPIEEMVALIKNSEGIRYAQKMADNYLNRAINALDILPLNSTRNLLENLARFVGNRSF